MGGKKKGGLSVLWIPRKKKHHGHGNHKAEENRPKASAFPSGSSHHKLQGIPFMPQGEHRVESSENISVHVDKLHATPKMAEKPLLDGDHSIEKDVNPSLEIDKAPTSSNDIDDDITETVKVTNEQYGDNIDSAYLRKPPPEKARPRSSPVPEEEDSCGDKCLLFLFRCLDFGLI